MPTLRSPVLDRVQDAPVRATGRDPWFDNAKMLLIVLVVVGHFWSVVPPTPRLIWAYDFIYAWHMPAFVLIAGYLSRSMTWAPDRLWNLVRTVAVPYLVFETALAYLNTAFTGDAPMNLLLIPYSPMWFLVALFAWRLATPALLRLPAGVAVAGAVVASIAIPMSHEERFDVARIVGLLPFFVLGLHLRPSTWTLVRSRLALPLAVAGLLTVVLFTKNIDENIGVGWVYYNYSYADLGYSTAHGAWIRLVMIGIGLIGSFSFFALVPRTRSWLSTLGAATLIVYLFHDFAVVVLRYTIYKDAQTPDLWMSILVPTAAAVALALLLAVPRIARPLNGLADPLGWFERRLRAPRSD